MAYQITRSKAVAEELKLVDENGQVVDTLVIRLDRAGLAKDARQKVIELTQAQASFEKVKTVLKDKEQLAEVYRHAESAYLSLIKVICGEADTKKLLDFYGGNVLEMSNAVTPFFIQVVIPKIHELDTELRKSKMRSYSRKKFFKR